MRTSKIQVLTVDDQTLFRKGTVMILNSFPEVGDVYEAGNGKEALAFLKEQVVDIVLLDLDMPVMDGREAARKILAKYPGIRIIVLSMVDSLQEISEMIEIGVHSYLIKSLEPEEVRKAINSVINNDFYYNNLVAKALHHKVKNAAMEKPGAYVSSSLTKREVEIISLICEEMTMKEIGEKLSLSEQTVHTHRKNIMRKVNVSNAVGLVKYAINQRIIQL